MCIFASDNTKNLKKLYKIADKVMALDGEFASKTDDQLRGYTQILKDRLAKGETLDDILPEAFALVRESAWRVLGEKPFYVQVVGGITLHQGRIAEMRTGEGKTLCATMPAYLNALAGKGVHVVTVNEFLATTQAKLMGKVYNFLGVSVGVILNSQSFEQKKQAYNCDITYCTNNELGFDYLRDNMATSKERVVQRGHYFCIVDEVDSILIDEARTPLIISGGNVGTSELYIKADKFFKTLTDEDYEIDEKLKNVRLTETGVSKAERFFKIDNLADITALEINHHINNALKANLIMKRDSQYIVQDDEILIVDEFTGRLMPGRRFSDGLHQAIEAKEGVKIKEENKTLATITFQNYFKLYDKMSGMTGTAKTEELEFNKIYSLDVVTIPTNRPVKRVDEQDMIFFSHEAKLKAIVEEVTEKYEKGQPILVGTVTIERSEEISKLLKEKGIPHKVLNAKNHAQESAIVAQAGRYKAVTIATNMAGRGTDIKLGGNPEVLTMEQMRLKGYDQEILDRINTIDIDLNDDEKKVKEEYDKLYLENKKITDEEHDKVIELGGLHILGTERHESRRIDNQLRGRAGRQGDPGSTIFFISLDDDLPQRFGEDRLKRWFAIVFKGNEDLPIQAKMLTRFFESAQKKTEQFYFSHRSTVLEYDDVLNKQRTIIYGERNKVLDGEDVHAQIVDMLKDVTYEQCALAIDDNIPFYEWDVEKINSTLETRLLPKGLNLVTKELIEGCDLNSASQKIFDKVLELYERKIAECKKIGFDYSIIERAFLLRVVDRFWMDHIDEMNTLRNEIFTQQYGQKDPLIIYKSDAFNMFDEMINRIREYTAVALFNARIEARFERPQQPQAQQPTANGVQGSYHADKTAGRNDLCPCGSGKKYKNCCGKGK
ncbi:MAG: preprotein translocase subunit SecA [Clostridia bacterium]|nr:preprotein translocase subunit SecA [Clostridia bacterium]